MKHQALCVCGIFLVCAGQVLVLCLTARTAAFLLHAQKSFFPHQLASLATAFRGRYHLMLRQNCLQELILTVCLRDDGSCTDLTDPQQIAGNPNLPSFALDDMMAEICQPDELAVTLLDQEGHNNL